MIVLLFLFFSLLISYFSDKTILTCGIWAWSGSNMSLFNADKFNILGMFNDNRGGDSAGKFMNRRLWRGIDTNALYKNLIKAFPTLNIEENTVAIGHARKASVGDKTIENTQPFYIHDPVVKDSSGNPKVLGVFMHNGTINNIEELCRKHGIEHKKGLSDSYYLGLMLFTVGTSVLSEYSGSAACMWIPWNNRNSLFAFKGESLLTKWATVPVEERPIFIYKQITDRGNSFWLSSTSDSLECAFQIGKSDKEQVLSLDTNTVYKIVKDKLYVTEKIDRTKIYQEEKPATTFLGYNYRNRHDYSGYNTPQTRIPLNWLDEPIVFENGGIAKIRFYRGRYHIYGKLAEGIIRLHKDGDVLDVNSKGGKLFYFLHGVMLRGLKDYKEALLDFRMNDITDPGVPKYPYKDFHQDILPYTDFPVSIYPSENKDKVFGWPKIYDEPDTRYTTTSNAWKFFSGIYHPVFSTKIYTFANADLDEVVDGSFNTYVDEEEPVTREFIADYCDNCIDSVIKEINKAIKDIDGIEPKDTEITSPYISTLETAKDLIYEELIVNEQNYAE